MEKTKVPLAHPIYEMETMFVIRFPQDVATKIDQELALNAFDNNLFLDIDVDFNKGKIKFHDQILYAKICNLPCIVECLKTLDRKIYYKSGDLSQILLCQKEPFPELENESSSYRKSKKERDKRFIYNHGLTPPLKNVRKRRFRKVIKKKALDLTQIEKEVRRLLQVDNEAEKVSWELLYDDNTRVLTSLHAKGSVGNSVQVTEDQESLGPSKALGHDKDFFGKDNQEKNGEFDIRKETKDQATSQLLTKDITGGAGEGSEDEFEGEAVGETELFGESLSSSSDSQSSAENDNVSSLSDDAGSEREDALSQTLGSDDEINTPSTIRLQKPITSRSHSARSGEKTAFTSSEKERRAELDDDTNELRRVLLDQLAFIENKKATHQRDLENVANPALKTRFQRILENLTHEENDLKTQLNDLT